MQIIIIGVIGMALILSGISLIQTEMTTTDLLEKSYTLLLSSFHWTQFYCSYDLFILLLIRRY